MHNDAARKFISNVAGEQRIKASHDRRNIFAHTFFPSRLYNPKRAERKKKRKKKKTKKKRRRGKETRTPSPPPPPPCHGHLGETREGKKRSSERERLEINVRSFKYIIERILVYGILKGRTPERISFTLSRIPFLSL